MDQIPLEKSQLDQIPKTKKWNTDEHRLDGFERIVMKGKFEIRKSEIEKRDSKIIAGNLQLLVSAKRQALK